MAVITQKYHTISEYARHRGVTVSTVSGAIRAGRLLKSVKRLANGRPAITDFATADAEWDANTMNRASREEPDLLAEAGVPPVNVSRARREALRAELTALDLAERQSKVMPIADVRKNIATQLSHFRTRLLALPTEARDRIPTLDDDGVDTLDQMIRQALSDLAEALG